MTSLNMISQVPRQCIHFINGLSQLLCMFSGGVNIGDASADISLLVAQAFHSIALLIHNIKHR